MMIAHNARVSYNNSSSASCFEGPGPHGAFSVANAIGTQLRGLINSALARWRITVLMETVAESGKGGWSPVSKHQIQPGCGE